MSQTLFSFILLLTISLGVVGQSVSTTSIPKDDLKKMLAHYREQNAESFVHDWMRRMPAPATTNASAHNEIIASLPPQIAKLRIVDRDLEEAVAQVLGPVLALYKRDRSYQIVVINYTAPTIMSDSVATLVISTGLLQRTTTDDELLGAAAHEIAHEFYSRRLRELKQQYQLLTAAESGAATEQTRIQLAKLELDCDAFAVMSLTVIGRNPTEFSNLLLGISRDFREQLAPDHPSAEVRASFMKSILCQEALDAKPQVTKQLLLLKSLTAQASAAWNKEKK